MARTIAKDHDEKREQIRRSAAKVFALEGFGRASMAELARTCGISKANIYHYYDGKEALLYDLLHDYLTTLRDDVIADDDPSLSPGARLRRVITKILLHYQGEKDFHQVQITSARVLPPDEQRTLREIQRTLVGHVSAILHANAPDIFSDDKAKLRAATMSIFGMLNWYDNWNAGAESGQREDYATLITDLTLKGVQGL